MRRKCFEALTVSCVVMLGVAVLTSCGKSSSSRASRDGSPSTVGDVLVGTQCPLGTMSNPVPGGFTLRGCRMDASELRISTPPGPILLSGDCAEKTLAIRSVDGAVDTTWQVPPDGEFSIVVPGFHGLMAWEGNPDCLASLTMEVDGKMTCDDRDRLEIRVESMRLWIAPPSEDQQAIHHAPACRLPQSCRLETSLELRQCG